MSTQEPHNHIFVTEIYEIRRCTENRYRFDEVLESVRVGDPSFCLLTEPEYLKAGVILSF
jgi:hypothetical protein